MTVSPSKSLAKNQLQRDKGSAIAFSAVLALILVLLGVAFVVISMYMGGGKEIKNAVDAGALNVGRKVLDEEIVSVNLSADANQQFFRDVTDTGTVDGKVTLRNINRVWAKALFVALNADAAGGDAGPTDASVQAAHDGALAISNGLAEKLTTAANLEGFFTDFAQRNSVRMIGTDVSVTVIPGAGWQTSLMNRAAESNIEIKDNLPSAIGGALVTACTRNPAPAGAAGKTFLRGYEPLTAAGLTFWQVPFQYEEKPHLVARSTFDNGKQPPNMLPAVWDNPPPNAFSVEGKAVKAGSTGELAMSWVLTNPKQTYPMQFPLGFIRIKLARNIVQWYPDGIAAGEDHYKFESDTVTSPAYPAPPCGLCVATAYVGNEYFPPSLYKAICAIEPIGGEAMNRLLQRVKEMNPDFTMNNLETLLDECLMLDTEDADHEFLLWSDGQGHMSVQELSAAVLPPGLDASQHPEGTDLVVDVEPGVPLYNNADFVIKCPGDFGPFPAVTELSGTRTWYAGTGFKGGCLGELVIQRKTDVYFGGICPCAP
jgi:hypothetical protein